jgi:hypothetical protein
MPETVFPSATGVELIGGETYTHAKSAMKVPLSDGLVLAFVLAAASTQLPAAYGEQAIGKNSPTSDRRPA